MPLTINQLKKIMGSQGEIDESEFNVMTHQDEYAFLNSNYQVCAINIGSENGESYVLLTNAEGRKLFPKTVYSPEQPLGKVAMRLVKEADLSFIGATDTSYAVGKCFRINDNSSDYVNIVRETLDALVQTQERIAKVQTNFEELLYQLSK